MNFIYSKLTSSLAIFFVLVSVFCIQLPTKYMDISLSMLFLFWAISGNYTYKFHKILSNPGAIVSLLLFLVIGLCTLFSPELTHESFRAWFRYHGLLFIPIIISLMDENKYRDYAINTFLACSSVVLLISYLKWFGIVPIDFIRKDGNGPVAFRHSISQSIFIAYAIYLIFHKCKNSQNKTQIAWFILILIFLANIFLVVNSRSGQISFIAMSGLFLYRYWKASYLKYLLALFFSLIVFSQFNVFKTKLRLFNIQNEIHLAQTRHEVNSAGYRLELWTNTLLLIKRHPLLGGGAGSLEREYKTFVPAENIVTATKFGNPHSTYILFLQESGLIGLAALIFLYYWHWAIASRLNKQFVYGSALKGLIICFAISSLFNCMLWGGEAKFYYLLAGIFLSAYKPQQQKKLAH
jgi:O-antigen ligase